MRRELIGLLLKRARGATLIMNTHIGEDAEAAGRIAFIYRGRVIAVGSPEELKNRFIRGRVLHIKISARLKEFENYLKEISLGGALTITDEGYRIYVEDISVEAEILRASESLGLRAHIAEDRPSLEDAYTVAVMNYEAKRD